MFAKPPLGEVGVQHPTLSIVTAYTHARADPIECVRATFQDKEDIPSDQQRLLFEGMSASIERTMRDHHLQYLFSHRPGLLQSLSDMRGQMISKSSTAQSYERLGVGIGQKPCMYNHTWLGSLFFPKECKNVCPFENVQSELVVVVFLRYGTYGKDAAPLAASVAKEWREIRKRHGV